MNISDAYLMAVMSGRRKEMLSQEQKEDAARLKALFRKRAGMSQELFGEKYGIGNQSTVSQYLNGGIPLNLTAAIKFAKGLGCAVAEFSPALGALSEVPFGEHSNIIPTPLPRGKVPLISWVQAGCWMEVVDNFAPGVADEWVDVDVDVRQHTFAITVRGDSMSPDFPEGMILVVEPDMQADNGDYVIARNGEHEATFKQLVIDGGVWFLKPLNERYPIMPISQGTTIIGVVREAITKRKLK